MSVPSQALVFTTGNWSTTVVDGRRVESVSVGGVTVEVDVDDDDALDESVRTVTLTASGGDTGAVCR